MYNVDIYWVADRIVDDSAICSTYWVLPVGPDSTVYDYFLFYIHHFHSVAAHDKSPFRRGYIGPTLEWIINCRKSHRSFLIEQDWMSGIIEYNVEFIQVRYKSLKCISRSASHIVINWIFLYV